MRGDRVGDRPRAVVVMGVSGAGKSTVGRMLATELGYTFVEADGLHSLADREQMHEGVALTDEERQPWLEVVGHQLAASSQECLGAVTACSALRKAHRDVLRTQVPTAYFVALEGPRALIRDRVNARHHSFMSPSLLDSQFDTYEPLQPDEWGVTIEVSLSPESVVAAALAALAIA